jgi:aminoglycoside 6-adenylyltransferase
MRTENEIIKNVLDVAEARDDVRAVIRTELLLQREYLYSYQFCFIVNDISEYEDDEVFETCFGDRILLFRGDRNYPEMFQNTKAHLMVYRDGITIVINAMDSATFLQKNNGDETHDNVWIGETYQKLLDKDNLLPEIERLTETQTIFASAPEESEFFGTCDEFWWVLKTFAEYTLREELPSAMFYLNVAVRDLLNRMVSWYLYLRDGEPVDVGILNSRFEKLLEEDLFLLYKKTYPDADYEHMWEAYTAVTELWNRLGRTVAEKRGFSYPEETEKNMLEFIRELRRPR